MAREPYALTVNDVARILGGWNPMSVYAKARRGEIPSYKVGYALRFDRDEILEWKKRNDQTQVEKKTETQKKWAEQLTQQRALQEQRRRKNPTPTPPKQDPPQRNSAQKKRV
jgi:excisionase family DNA binding protein